MAGPARVSGLALRFWLSELPRLVAMPPGTWKDTPFTRAEVLVDPAAAAAHNAAYAELCRSVAAADASGGCPPHLREPAFFALRLCTAIAAAAAGLTAAALASTLQLALLPLSAVVAAAVFPIAAVVLLPYYLAVSLLPCVLPWHPAALALPVSEWYCGAFLAADLAVCLWAHAGAGVGAGAGAPSAGRRMGCGWHLYGYADTRAHHVIVLMALWSGGFTFDPAVSVLACVLVAALRKHPAMRRSKLLQRALYRLYHMIAHLPGVYEQAHRFHHRPPDATPFGAHTLGGAGGPETWLCLIAELAAARYLGAMPLTVSPLAVFIGVGNTFDHTRKPGGGALANWHADHHAHHLWNVGPPVADIVFGTAAPPAAVATAGAIGYEVARTPQPGGMELIEVRAQPVRS
eukprot:TRINITY_DN60240_c0_g1_i1.p1 TRINITY_DN60240_c0_g1~~TRINITY_DN60240_c0_g1_i1.p1  ORF type:complete len:404 (+),score=71.41 TRINITY_DN60240_c0_g1_i1:80-1291(+)